MISKLSACTCNSARHAFGVAYALHFADGPAGQPYGLFYDLHDPVFVMLCGISRLKTFARRGDVSMPDIAKDVYAAIWAVLNYTAAELVGRPFEPEGIDRPIGITERIDRSPAPAAYGVTIHRVAVGRSFDRHSG